MHPLHVIYGLAYAVVAFAFASWAYYDTIMNEGPRSRWGGGHELMVFGFFLICMPVVLPIKATSRYVHYLYDRARREVADQESLSETRLTKNRHRAS